MITAYKVIDKKTGQELSEHATRKDATRKANRLDRQYGAVRYRVKPVFSN